MVTFPSEQIQNRAILNAVFENLNYCTIFFTCHKNFSYNFPHSFFQVSSTIPDTVSTPAPIATSTGYTVIDTTPKPVYVSSTLATNTGVYASSPTPETEISHSHGATGFKGVTLVKAQPQHKERKPLGTSPPLFGGFSVAQSQTTALPPVERPKRKPKRPQPVYRPASPTYKPAPVLSTTGSYDPFSFGISTTPDPSNNSNFKDDIEDLKDEIMSSIRPVTPNSLDDESNTVVPVYLTSEYPELRRVPKDASSGGPNPAANEITDRYLIFF